MEEIRGKIEVVLHSFFERHEKEIADEIVNTLTPENMDVIIQSLKVNVSPKARAARLSKNEEVYKGIPGNVADLDKAMKAWDVKLMAVIKKSETTLKPLTREKVYINLSTGRVVQDSSVNKHGNEKHGKMSVNYQGNVFNFYDGGKIPSLSESEEFQRFLKMFEASELEGQGTSKVVEVKSVEAKEDMEKVVFDAVKALIHKSVDGKIKAIDIKKELKVSHPKVSTKDVDALINKLKIDEHIKGPLTALELAESEKEESEKEDSEETESEKGSEEKVESEAEAELEE